GSEVADVRIEVSGSATIEGSVLRDGAPASSARIYTEGSPVYRVTQADDDGRFRLDALQPGTYTIVSKSEDGGSVGEVRSLVLADGDEKRGITIELTHAASVRGLVVDANGKGVPDVSVELHESSQAQRAFALTDKSGAFSAGPLVDGTYEA